MNSIVLSILLVLHSLGVANAFTSIPAFSRQGSSLSMTSEKNIKKGGADISRMNFVSSVVTSTITVVGSSIVGSETVFAEDDNDSTVKLASGVSYKISNAGDGPKPEVGELAAIRFKAVCVDTGNTIDDIFNTPEPYYTRVGSGGMLKGVEEVLPKMRVGDRWVINIPGSLAFGPKGRPSSAGKPRIPSNATIQFDVEMVGLPGKEPELIELIGDT